MADEPRQFWIRNDKHTTWGPLTFATIEVLIGNGALPGKLQASRDGLRFVWPGRLPEVRDAFPKELWGETGEPLADDAPAAAPVGSPRPPPPTVSPPKVSPPKVEPPKADAPKPEPSKPKAPQATVPVGEGVPASGDLAAFPPFRLYYLAATANQSGRLTLNGTNASYEVFFKKGAPEAARSSLEEEDLGSFLEKKGALKPDQIAQARKLAPTVGGELLNALFGLQFLSPGDAFKHLGEHALGLLTKAFSLETKGSFSFDPKAPVPATAMPLGDRWKLICDMVRAIPVDDLKSRLAEELDAPVMKSGGRVEMSQLKLTPQETRASSYFDGVRSLNQLCTAIPNEAEVIVRTAFLLYRFEACSFADTGPRVKSTPPPKTDPPKPAASAAPPKTDPPKPAAAAKPAAAPPPKSPPPKPAINPGKPPVIGGAGGKPAQAARPAPAARPPPVAPAKPAAPAAAPAPAGPGNDPAALKAFLAGLAEKNHFQVIGVPESCTSAQVKTAFFQLAKALHPDTVPAGAPPEVGKLKADIFARINEANAALSDDQARAAYLEELHSGKEKLDAAAIFASEESFQKACILVKARKYPEAVKMFEEAIKLYDKEGEYFIWHGWSRFLVAGDKRAIKDEALKEIDQGLKLSPKCAQGVYFKGQIHKLLGDATTAQKFFKEALAIDPNHLESQREVRQR